MTHDSNQRLIILQTSEITSFSPSELLKTLRSFPFLTDYNLALYSRPVGIVAQAGPIFDCFAPLHATSLCGDTCRTGYEESARTAIDDGKISVFRCPAGILCFTVPFKFAGGNFSCLLGGGVRENIFDLETLDMMSGASSLDPFKLIEDLESIPAVSMEQLSQTAERAGKLLASLHEGNLYAFMLEKTLTRLEAISAVIRQIGRVDKAEDAISLFSETLGLLFDFPMIAVGLPLSDAKGFCLKGTWGLPRELGILHESHLPKFNPSHGAIGSVPLEEPFRQILGGTKAEKLVLIPLKMDRELHGIIAILDSELHPHESMLIDLLTSKLAAKLDQLKRDMIQQTEKAATERLIGFISSLSLTENNDELHQRILEFAAELMHADSGSLMLIEEGCEKLQIKAALGLNEQLAKIISLKIGSGISGRVAATGQPIVVVDIEKDRRTAGQNRPRFKSKSFISVPLRLRGNTIGVLNLSDRRTGAPFTEIDLRLLTTFAQQASLLIERRQYLERASELEQLSVTDALTSLYNRRFLEKRLNEEISRCKRSNAAFTVMLIDIDHFKIYNDICGHLAGDSALRKTARLLGISARQMDIVTRYGGEEFCVVLPDAHKKEAMLVAERIRRQIENEPFAYEERLPKGKLTASIGFSSFPDDGQTLKELINTADIALYRAKARGRNRTVVFEPAMKLPTADIPHVQPSPLTALSL